MLDEQQLDELLVEWEECRQSGHESSAEELCQNSPELLVELKNRITRLKSTDWLFEEDADDDLTDGFLVELLNKAAGKELALGSVPYDACVRYLTEAGLVSVEQLQRLESVLSDSTVKTDGSNLLRHLVATGKLTSFRATTVADGNAKSLVLGNYVLLEKIGAGGMGQVFLARHRRMNRQVALKVLPERAVSSAIAVERFRREVEVAAKLVHPNIVTAYDADEANGTHFLVMEFVNGPDLASFVKRSGPLPLQQAVAFLLQAAAGLEYAHRQGVVHRDIKPSNLLVDANGTVKVLDLGLARLVMGTDSGNAPTQAELTQDGAVLGTVDYMAPEQALNTKVANGQADIYALGCTLYYLLTGQAIYLGETLMQKMLAHREAPIPSLQAICPEVPEQVESIFKKMVSKKPEDRHSSMASLIAEFKSCERCWQNASTSSVVINRVRPPYAVDTVSEDGRQVTKEYVPEKVGKPPRRTIYFAGAVVLLGLASYFVLFSGVIFRVRTPHGTLIVTINQPDAVVFINDDQVTVSKQDGTEPLRIDFPTAGGQLKVSKPGFETWTRDFRLKENGEETVHVVLEPHSTPVAELPAAVIVSPRQMSGDEVAEAVALVKRLGGSAEINYRSGKPHVEAVDLRETQVTDEELGRVVIALPTLRTLSLEYTPISDAGLAHLKQLSNLQNLDLSQVDHPFTDAGIEHLAGMSTLESLDLEGSHISDVGVKHLQELHRLRDLWLFGIFTDTGLQSIEGLTNLTRLWISSPNISDVGLKHLAHLSRLELLSLADTPINGSGLVHVETLVGIVELSLENTAIEDRALDHLMSLRNLESLHLTGTRVTVMRVEQLRKSLPHLSTIGL